MVNYHEGTAGMKICVCGTRNKVTVAPVVTALKGTNGIVFSNFPASWITDVSLAVLDRILYVTRNCIFPSPGRGARI